MGKNSEYQKWCDGFVKHLVEEVFRAVDDTGVDATQSLSLMVSFTACYLGALSLKTLTDASSSGDYNKAEEAYKQIKSSLEAAVAAGFTGGVLMYSGKQDIEYYCQIKPVPKATNLPC